MDTLSFLRAILPVQGVYYVALLQTGRQGLAHKAYTSLEAMATAVEAFDRHPDIQVYHACASYKKEYIVGPDPKRPGETKKFYRIPENTLAAKALWADIDCGQKKFDKGEGYLTKTDAAKAILGFCKSAGFPTPLLIDSGNGVHVYWPFTTEVAANEWRAMAGTFKAILRHFGVLADPSRTSDLASVLRPVGASNKKDAANWKKVIGKTTAGPYTPMEILAALNTIVSNHNVNCESVSKVVEEPSFLDNVPDALKAMAAAVGDAEDLAAHAYPDVPTDATEIAKQCQQVAVIRDTGGGNYEHWRRVIGIVKFCENGDEIAHKWSEKDVQYDPDETQAKLDTWNTPPSTCEALEQANPGGCNGCPFKGKIKTPMVLGRVEKEQPAQELHVEIEGKAAVVEIPPAPFGYIYDTQKKVMYRQIKNKDGIVQSFEFCKLVFYPTTRIRQADGSFSTRVRAHMPDKAVRDFDIPSSTIASAQELLKSLANHEIFASTASRDSNMHIHAYMRDALHKLLNTAKEMHTMTSFGWKNNMEGFLIGDRLYQRDGSMRRVILGGYAAGSSTCFPEPRGTIQGWADGVNFLYNRADMEPLQYAVCSGFGSILTPLGDNTYHGIPLALTGSETGRGKTTACKSAIYAFGDAEKLLLNGKDGATVNARWAKMSAMNNIPILFDEMSNSKPADLSALLYGASNGKDKERLVGTKTGVDMAAQQTWDMSIFITANNELNALLATEKGNTEAEAMRVMEIKTDRYNLPELEVNQVQAASNQTAHNMGMAGEAFVKYVVANLNDVIKRFIETNDRLVKVSPEAKNQKHRYYRNHATCTLVAAEIMVELELIDFDVEHLFNWTVAHIAHLCSEVEETNTMNGEEAMSRMLVEFGPQIITTNRCHDGRNGALVDTVPAISKGVVGRRILGTTDKTEPLAGRLYLSKKEIKDWCQRQRVPLSLVLNYAREQDVLIDLGEKDHFTLGRGTNLVSGTPRCVCLNIEKLEAKLMGAPHLVHSKKEDAA